MAVDQMFIKAAISEASHLLAHHRAAAAIGVLEPLIHQVESPDNELLAAHIGRLLGVGYLESGRIGDAHAVLQGSLLLARQAGREELIAMCLHELSWVLWKEYDLAGAIAACKESIDLQIDQGFVGAEGHEPHLSLYTLAVLYYENRQFEDARELLEEVRESCEARQDLSGLVKAHNELALVSERLNDLRGSVRHFRESLRLKRQIGDAVGIRTTVGNIRVFLANHPEVVSEPGVVALLGEIQSP
jgi:tetratricopeptide (TPR) repeat protein